MPYPSPPRTLAGPRRRSVLAAAVGAALLAGCSSGPDGDDESADGSSAALRAQERAARDSVALRERYDATIAAFPALAVRLAPLRAEVDRHARAFGWTPHSGGGRTPGAGGTEATRTPSAPSSVSPVSPSPSAATEKDALAALAGAERALAERRTAALQDVPGEPARLLASVAAAGAAHVYLLTESGNAK
ncbi:hypothetical protein [Streptomyces sp. MAA16]|uniref:hypothetical protein n=1 Tax=Streptomyces sp. MAA16 TaxID=3035116 RepID=UPI0024743447|nr:hypothetical protein [Streptomyces sp. MAA16]MDH6700528.1 hypothetical protein [Streptomyces sp. MAA16]